MNNKDLKEVSEKNYYARWAEVQAKKAEIGFESSLGLRENTSSAYLSLNKAAKEQPKPEITFNRTPTWMQSTYGLTKQTNIYGLLRTNNEYFGVTASAV